MFATPLLASLTLLHSATASHHSNAEPIPVGPATVGAPAYPGSPPSEPQASGQTGELLRALPTKSFELDARALAELIGAGALQRLGETPRGHAGGVRAVALGAGAAQVLSAGPGGEVGLWRASDAELVAESLLVSESEGEGCIAARFLGDGERAVTVWTDGTCRIVDLPSFHEVRRFEGLGPCSGFVVSRDGALLATVPTQNVLGSSAEVQVFEVEGGAPIAAFGWPDGNVHGVALSADGQRIALVGTIGARAVARVHERDEAGGYGPPLVEATVTKAAASSGATAVALSADGTRLALGALGSVHLVDLGRDRALQPLEWAAGAAKHAASTMAAASALVFSGDGTYLFVGTADGELCGFTLEPRRLAYRIEAHAARVDDLAASADGSLLVSGGGEGALRFFDGAQGTELHLPPGATGSITALVFDADETRLVVGGRAGRFAAFDHAGAALPSPSAPAAIRAAGAATLVDLAVDSHGRLLAAYPNGVYDLDRAEDGPLAPVPDPITALAGAPAGDVYATGHTDGITRVWRGAELRYELKPEGKSAGEVLDVALDRAGTTVTALSANGRRTSWTVDGGGVLYTVEPSAGAAAVQRLPWIDPSRVLCLDERGGARLERVDGVLLSALELRPGTNLASDSVGTLPALALTHDGAYVATLLQTHGLVLFDAASGAVALQLQYAGAAARAICFTPDGARIIAGHRDGTLTVWDLAALAEWARPGDDAEGVAGGGATTAPPTIGGEAVAPGSTVPMPDPDALRPRRRRVEAFDTRLAAARTAAGAGELDLAEETLWRTLGDLIYERNAATRLTRAQEVHAALATLPGIDGAPYAALADAYLDLARAYQRKAWVEVGELCLDVTDLFAPGKGDRVRAALARAKPKPVAKPRAKDKPAASQGGLALREPHEGWTIDGARVAFKEPLTGQPAGTLGVLLDSAPSEDMRLVVDVESSGGRRQEFGVVFGATEQMGSGYALVLLHTENTKLIIVSLREVQGGTYSGVLAQRRITLDTLPEKWRLAVEVRGQEVTLEAPGSVRFTIPLEAPAHGHHGFVRLAGGDKPTVFERVEIKPAPGEAVSNESAAGAPPRLSPDAPIDERVRVAEAYVPFGEPEGCVAHLLRARQGLALLPDESLALEQGTRIRALLEAHDSLDTRHDRARLDAVATLIGAARQRLESGRPGAASALFELARTFDIALADEALASSRPIIDQVAGLKRGAPGGAPQPLDNGALVAHFGDLEGRREFWVGGWSTIGASLASPLLADASSLLRGAETLPDGAREISVEVRMENRGAAGLALGCGEDGSFLAVTFDAEAAQSSVTIARWTGDEGQGWDSRASETQHHSPESMDGWTTIHVRREGTHITARIGKGAPVSAQIPTRWSEGPLGLLAIGQHGPQRVRFRNLVVR